MKFYSTNSPDEKVDLKQAVTQGLAPDNGLYMPEVIPRLPQSFFDSLGRISFQEIGVAVARNLLGDSIPDTELVRIVNHTIQFDAPLVALEQDIFALELFHGPTLAFKDFGARFMSQLLGYFASQQDQEVVILVATSGDTGSAVANGFLGVAGIRVVVLYPTGKVSDIQEKQFTTLGQNITALEIDGTFDDCQKLVKESFLDADLKKKFALTSANSINIARLIPQSFYYFHGYGQLSDKSKPVAFCVPSGNFGNVTGGLLAQRMGLPISQLIAATNSNDVVPEFFRTHVFKPRPSQQTISNAMDVGNPSNIVRMIDLYKGDIEAMVSGIKGYAFSDDETKEAMNTVFAEHHYTMDPHGAIAYMGVKRFMEESNLPCTGIFLETAHPAKFKEVVEAAIGEPVAVPPTLQKFLSREKKTIRLDKDFEAIKDFMLNRF
ncbi:MAG: threonine synthase [Chryseolinea sp.]